MYYANSLVYTNTQNYEIIWKNINIITQLIESVRVYINYIAALVSIMEFLDWAWCEWFKIIILVRTTEFGFL